MLTWEDLNKLVQALACPKCKGDGKLYDGEPGDIYMRTWTCPAYRRHE